VISEACAKGRLAYILVLGGTNDILRNTGSAAQIFGRLRQLHEKAGRAPYMPRVGVLTLPPIKSVTAAWEQIRLSVNESLRKACQVSGAMTLAQKRQFVVDLDGVDASLSSDGVHFTAAGYAEFARRVFEAMLADLPRPKVASSPPGL